MSSPAFRKALTATGYLEPDGAAAPNLHRVNTARTPVRLRQFLSERGNGLEADAAFSAHGTTVSIFKDLGHRDVDGDELRMIPKRPGTPDWPHSYGW